MGRKHCGKRRNCSLRAISPFPTVFSKDLKTRVCLEMSRGYFLTNVKIQVCLAKGQYIIFRASVDASQLVLSEVEILQPMTLTLDLGRNIAASWFHDVPDIDIQGTLEAVKVRFLYLTCQVWALPIQQRIKI